MDLYITVTYHLSLYNNNRIITIKNNNKSVYGKEQNR